MNTPSVTLSSGVSMITSANTRRLPGSRTTLVQHHGRARNSEAHRHEAGGQLGMQFAGCEAEGESGEQACDRPMEVTPDAKMQCVDDEREEQQGVVSPHS